MNNNYLQTQRVTRKYNLLLLALLQLLHCCCSEFSSSLHPSRTFLNLSDSCDTPHCSIAGLSSSHAVPLQIANSSAPHLLELLLRNSVIRSLPLELLRQSPNLQALLMPNCGLNRLNVDDFWHAPQLQRLVLPRNHIGRLVEHQFMLLSQLQLLELSNNNILLVHQQAFEGLTQLQLLDLQGNGMRTLMPGALEPLLELRQLDLSGNQLEKLNAQTFARNLKLQTLLLNDNHFAEFEPSALSTLPPLQRLDISNCVGALTELRLNSVNTLIAEGSGIERLIINGSVHKLQASNNKLTQLAISDRRAVIELNLHGNLLGSNVTALLAGMLNLERLDLSKNIIEYFEVSNNSVFMLLLPSLTQLNLADNQLRALTPESMLLLSRLRQLDVSFNHLLSISVHSFEPLVNLERLYIEGNRLQEFDYVLLHQQHAHLQELGLLDNEWEFDYKRKMFIYLTDRGVHLPARLLRRKEDDSGTLHQLLANMAPLAAQAAPAHVTGIHPYWTTHDVLTFTTLLVVFIILLLQFYHILKEEGCLHRWQSRSWLGLSQANGRQRGAQRPQRLNEEHDSQV